MKVEENDPGSVLSFWKGSLQLRRAFSGLFVDGEFEPFDMENLHTFVYSKTRASEVAVVVLNFSGPQQPVSLPKAYRGMEFCLSTAQQQSEDLALYGGRLYLAAQE